MPTRQRDYKPVPFCVHNCQMPIYTTVIVIYCQLQIIRYLNCSLLATSNCTSFIPKTSNTGNIDWEIYGLSAQVLLIKTQNMNKSCNIGKSTKKPKGIWEFFYVTACLYVLVQHVSILSLFISSYDQMLS